MNNTIEKDKPKISTIIILLLVSIIFGFLFCNQIDHYIECNIIRKKPSTDVIERIDEKCVKERDTNSDTGRMVDYCSAKLKYKVNKFVVKKLPTIISCPEVNVTYNSDKYLVATLKDQNSNLLSDLDVIFKVNNKTYTTKRTLKVEDIPDKVYYESKDPSIYYLLYETKSDLFISVIVLGIIFVGCLVGFLLQVIELVKNK